MQLVYLDEGLVKFIPGWCESHLLGQESQEEQDQRRRKIEETPTSSFPNILKTQNHELEVNGFVLDYG